MLDYTALLESLKQHHQLSIRVTANCNTQLLSTVYQQLLTPHRSRHYVLTMLLNGEVRHDIDLQPVLLQGGQMLFVLPHQIHHIFPREEHVASFTITFDEHCLSLLPRSYLMLLNPLFNQVLTFDAGARQRVINVFETLHQLLQDAAAPADLVLAHLNTLLAECSHTYMRNHKKEGSQEASLSKFIAFKQMVEEDFMEQPAVQTLANRLSLTANGLYSIVKQYAGVSPKEFMINRLMVEAQRKLYYSETTAKELAYELGFSDPGYFSRLFKKSTGKSITQFVKEMQDLYAG
jgi:AraC-like DNA-binding protein